MSIARWRWAIAAGMLPLLSSTLHACIPVPIHKTFYREPILRTQAPSIVKGTTTRAEIERRLGRPDLEVDGTRVTVYSDTPLTRYYDSWKAAPGWQRGVAYSSLDEEHIALVYFELDINSLVLIAPTPGVAGAGFRLTALRNKLLVLVRKDTGIVDDWAYREEFTR